MTDIMNDWYGPDAATFGDRVAAARESAGMTQGQLARRMGVKKTTLIGWEQDLSEPRANKLSMLSGLLNVSMSWLLTGEGDDLSAPSEDTLGEDICRAPAGALQISFGDALHETRHQRDGYLAVWFCRCESG